MTTPADILNDAKLLNEGATSEARRRAVVSRAYYAVYHHILSQSWAKDFTNELVQIGKEAEAAGRHAPGRHSLLQRWLGKSPNRSIKYAGSQLADLMSRRVNADYRLHQTMNQLVSTDAVELAEEIIYDTLAEIESVP